MIWDSVVIGGGASGFFAAITLQRVAPERKVVLFEKTNVLLTKVRISGGGRCNVTHHCFDPQQLVRHYPRGSRELLGSFHRFQPRDTIDWFAKRGVKLVVESDGRMFPNTHSSETIAQALMAEAERVGLPIRTQVRINHIKKDEQGFALHFENGDVVYSKTVVLASGSSRDGHQWAKALGHRIKTPVPSLFTFNCPSSPLKPLSGVSVERAGISLEGSSFTAEGPLLITHFGFSGPAILRTSAFAARWLAEKGYKAKLQIRWLLDLHEEDILRELQSCKEKYPKRLIATGNPFGLPNSLWTVFAPDTRWQDLSIKQMRQIAARLLRDTYVIEGKTTHKEEFVTCGGVALDEVNFKTMESRKCPGLFFAGEILDVDGVTGGFNFQNAWTTGFCAALGCAERLRSLNSSNEDASM